MATCRFPDCDMQDLSSVFPPGWILVVTETRGLRTSLMDIRRRKWLLCPIHAPLVTSLCAGPEDDLGGDESVQVDPRRFLS
jgi:hypothetical protein